MTMTRKDFKDNKMRSTGFKMMLGKEGGTPGRSTWYVCGVLLELGTQKGIYPLPHGLRRDRRCVVIGSTWLVRRDGDLTVGASMSGTGQLRRLSVGPMMRTSSGTYRHHQVQGSDPFLHYGVFGSLHNSPCPGSSSAYMINFAIYSKRKMSCRA